jgi:hypothetical protein
MKHKIVWEKWLDPFGTDFDETKWMDYDNEEENYEDDGLVEEVLKSRSTKPVKVISTPMGIIPYNEYTASGKIFNFWVGHTNFDITQAIVDILEKFEGVEILDIFTRYRFRIGIGKCFEDKEILSNINNNIEKYFNYG